MANWGDGPKYLVGEVDVFKVMPDHELYGHMNINYLRLDDLPRFDDGWQPVVDALRHGRFFVSTGEVLLPDFRANGKRSGETITLGADGRIDISAKLEWTFPPSFAEIIWGDGQTTHRHRIDLADQPPFGDTTLRLSLNLPTARWLRLEAWDIAANGAFTQPVWVKH